MIDVDKLIESVEHLNEIGYKETHLHIDEVLALISELRSAWKDVDLYKNLYKSALKEAKQQYEWRMEDSECGHCEIKEGLDMLEYRIQNSADKENEDD
jgi:hypothetical protein